MQERAYVRPSSSHAIRCTARHTGLSRGGHKGAVKTSRPQWTSAYGRLEKTQDYTKSDLDASTRDQLVAVRSTRRARTTFRWSAKAQG